MKFSAVSARLTASLAALSLGVSVPASPAQAQATPNTIVSVCSGVSLPRSVVTSIISPVITGIYAPIETNINGTLSALTNPVLNPLLNISGLPAPLSVNVNGLLTQAASGSNIGLNVIANDGTLVGPGDPCNAEADSFTLSSPAGVAIGGNSISGLGASGQAAVAGEINSIAIGNRARTNAAALNSIAFGPDALVGAGGVNSIAFGSGSSVSVANSVALGAGSVASRGPQAGSAGEISVGAPGALRQITNVAAGTSPTDVATVGQVQAIAAQLSNNAVQYTDGTFSTVGLAGAAGTTVNNVAPGALSATSTDAVNGSQLFATNQQVASNTTAITSLQGDVSVLQGAVAGNTAAITNLQTSVSGLQTSLAGNTTAITNLQGDVANINIALGDLQVDVGGLQTTVSNNSTAITNLQSSVGGNTTAINNLQVSVTNNTADISALENTVVDIRTDLDALEVTVNNLSLSNAGPVRYSNAATPTVPNGGTPTNDATLVGAAPGPVALHNVASGAVAAGSTDAVNGGQLFATNTAVAAAQQTAAAAQQSATNAQQTAVAAQQSAATAQQTAAAAQQTATTAQQTAVAAQQSAATAQQTAVTAQQTATGAQQTANQALALGQNAVAYDSGRTSVTLGGSGASQPVALRNVAAGTAGTDGVNLNQVRDLADNALRSANRYTDERLAAFSFDLAEARREARAGSAAALAAAGMPQAMDAGANMIAAGVGTYRGRTAIAIGASHRTERGNAVFRIGVTYDSSNSVGASGGAGFQF